MSLRKIEERTKIKAPLVTFSTLLSYDKFFFLLIYQNILHNTSKIIVTKSEKLKYTPIKQTIYLKNKVC